MNIVEKIKKLLALSQSSNANEAALAASRAQELMVKYAIDEAALQPSERTNEPIESETVVSEYNRLPTWHALLAYILAPSFFCRSFYGRGSKYSKACIYYVGRKSDRESLIATYNFLKAEIEKMAEIGWAKQPEEIRVHGKRWKTSFYEGVCVTVKARLQTTMAQLVADNSNTAIVLADKQKAVDDFVSANHKLAKSSRSNTVDTSGYTAGVVAGHSLNLGARASKQLTA